MAFLPIRPDEVSGEVDFVIVTGDAYVDHSSFGTAVVGRVLQAAGYSVAVIAQPDWHDAASVTTFGRPRLAFLINSGNIDSMVAHYTVSKKRRGSDYYSPGGKAGMRPDRAVIVYCNLVRSQFGDVPIIIGGIEASTRRFAHYDYWSDRVRRSILPDSRADMLTYGMGENVLRRIAFLLNKGVPINKIRDVRGTCFMEKIDFVPKFAYEFCGEYSDIKSDRKAFANAFKIQYENQNSYFGKAVVEGYGDRIMVQNPPMPPLTTEELDAVYELPYERAYHPVYESMGGVPALSEVKFSITHNRGCYGNCNFCSIAFHQGRQVVSRSTESVVREVKLLTKMKDFKGYIHDVGGPTANFRGPICKNQKEGRVCTGRECLYPKLCPNARPDHTAYIELLEAVKAVDGVKKVFIRSGIRHDFVNADKSSDFINILAADHVSGQLRLAPEHVSDRVLSLMGKPPFAEYERFKARFDAVSASMGIEQYCVPYLMSSHPGSTLEDALELALYLRKHRLKPEQVQDFYPTPGTASTCMFYTGINPFSGKSVYVPRSYEEKKVQRALLQSYDAKNAPVIKKALSDIGRADLIPVLLSGNKKRHAAPELGINKHFATSRRQKGK